MYGPAITTTVRANANPDADLSLMPSGLAISRQLGPSVAVLRRTEHGIEFVSRGTIPLPSACARSVVGAGGLRVTVPPRGNAPPAAEAPPATTASPGALQPAAVPAQPPARRRRRRSRRAARLHANPPCQRARSPVRPPAHQPQPGPRHNRGPARPANDRPTSANSLRWTRRHDDQLGRQAPGAFDSQALVCPANYNFPQGSHLPAEVVEHPAGPAWSLSHAGGRSHDASDRGLPGP